MLTRVIGQEPQDQIAVLLQKGVLPAVPAVGVGVGQVLGTIQLDRKPQLRSEEVHLHFALLIKGIFS